MAHMSFASYRSPLLTPDLSSSDDISESVVLRSFRLCTILLCMNCMIGLFEFFASSVRSSVALRESDCTSIWNLDVSDGVGSMLPNTIISPMIVRNSNAEDMCKWSVCFFVR